MNVVFYQVALVMVTFGSLVQVTQSNSYALDRQGTCGQYLTVYESDLTLTARSNVAPANPPLRCEVFLQSAYEKADGRYRLQMVVEQLQVGDCSITLSFYNGYGASGNYIRKIGCGEGSTDIIYSNDRRATVLFERPQNLYDTDYAITISVRTYASGDEVGTLSHVAKLPTGAIIGIVIGVVVLIAAIIILCWCCFSGYIHRFTDPKRTWNATPKGTAYSVGYAGRGAKYEGSVDSNLEKLSTTSSTTKLKNGINFEDPAVWSSVTGQSNGFRRGVPRKATGRGANNEGLVEMRMQGRNYQNTGRPPSPPNGVRDSHAYEPYDVDTDVANRSPRFRKRQDDAQRGSNRSRGSRRSRNSAEGGGGGKETVIDDPGTASTTDDDIDVKKPPSDTDDDEEDMSKLNRFESEADVDTIVSPMHVNAGVRASIPDLTNETAAPTQGASPKPKKRGSASPKSRKKPKGQGQQPDPMALPPEAFDPVFTTPTSQEQYPGEFRPPPQMMSMPFMPYGMYPMMPGQQTYAYAYQQAAPQYGPPGNQGAYFVQSVPTADGSMQNTAFAMQSSRTPKRKGSKGKGGVGGGQYGHPGNPDFTSTPSSHGAPDMSLVTADMAPPDPGPGHRSMAMKSFADPDTGMQTTQVLWTDNVPDPTDPLPGDSSQVTRKTTTRVTTRSGQGDLPTETATLLDYQDPNPAFLSPSTPQHPPQHLAAITPNTSNVDYYLGQQGSEPQRPPDVVHTAPSRSNAIRDRLTLRDSSDV